MTSKPDYIKVKVGMVPVLLPVHINREITEKIVQQVEERLERIEKESDTIDTQRFAIQAAYEFAVDLFDLEEQYKADEVDLIKVLQHMSEELRQLIKHYGLAPLPKEE